MSSRIGIGDRVEFPLRSGKIALVVDIDPPDTSTPYPSFMLAWRERGRILEGVVEAKYVRKVRA